MDEHEFPAAERILNDIGSAFKKDRSLDEFHIIPVTLNKNKSPVHIALSTLGLEAWCVPHVYCYAYNLLMDIKQKRRREDTERVDQLLMGALLLNPENKVLWTMRRELPNLDPQFELHFSAVVLTRKPKSSEVFNYREWLIKNMLHEFPSDPGLVMSEVETCQQAAEQYANNYYAWRHRMWCINQLPQDSDSYTSFLVSEWKLMSGWVLSHVSDFSGFQYRQHLLAKLLKLMPGACSSTADVEESALSSLQTFLYPLENQRDSKLTEKTNSILLESSDNKCESFESLPFGLVLCELLLNTDMIFVYPGHEAIWYHRRFIFHLFTRCLKGLLNQAECQQGTHKDNNGVSLEKAKRGESISESLILRLRRFETILYSKCKSEKDRQAGYAERHRAWLASIMKLDLELPLR